MQSPPVENDFSVLELANRDASVYLCDGTVDAADPGAYGTYYGTPFRWKVPGDGALGLL